MKTTNKQTILHKDHEIEVRRADPKAPHYGFYYCVTCNKFVTWIDKRIYQQEKYEQKQENIMWFGKYQGTPISKLPQDYLEWAIMNVNGSKSDMKKLDDEYLKRQNPTHNKHFL